MEITESDYVGKSEYPDQVIEVLSDSIQLTTASALKNTMIKPIPDNFSNLIIENTNSVIVDKEKSLCNNHYKIGKVQEIMKSNVVLPKAYDNVQDF